jgi:hypothetical protein
MLERSPLYQVARPRRQRVCRRFRHGVCTAALRAVTAARLYLSGTVPNLAKAAVSCGSNVCYVRAAIAVLRSENAELLDFVVHGRVSLLAAARQVEPLVNLIDAYRAANQKDRVASFRTLGPERVFDEIVLAAAS